MGLSFVSTRHMVVVDTLWAGFLVIVCARVVYSDGFYENTDNDSRESSLYVVGPT